MTPMRKSLLIVAAIVVMVGCQHVAQADPLVLSLQNNSFSIAPGGSVTLVASVFNSGATNTNTDTITPIIGGSVVGFWVVDNSMFDATFLNQAVTNGTTLGPLAFITYTDQGKPLGSYNGDVFFFYSNGTEILSTNVVPFTIRIAAPVPEPTTITLLSMGLAGVAAKVRKRRKAA